MPQHSVAKHLQLSRATLVLISRSVSFIVFVDEDGHRLNAGGRILLKNQHGENITAKYVVITVPLTILLSVLARETSSNLQCTGIFK